MFIELIQSLIKVLNDIWQYLSRLLGLPDEQAQSKKSDWNNGGSYTPDYFQPQFYDPNHSLHSNFRQRGLAMDVDRSTNQASQSSAVTLPRPFYSPLRQTAPGNLTNRAANQKQKQSLVELLLEQQKEAALLEPTKPSTQRDALAAEDVMGEHAPTPPVADDEYDCSIDFGDTNTEEKYKSELRNESPTPKMENIGGLRGSRPIVTLNRMRFITQMMREGNDGDRMGDYAPESLNNTPEANTLREKLATTGAIDAETTEVSPLRPRNYSSSSYPTLSLKDLSLLNIIGGGGFGQVWRGTWGGTPVAVKLLSNLLLPQGDGPVLPEHEQLLTAFEEEVSMLAQLRHPNICLFLGVCLEPPHRAIVTELVSRGSLWDCLRIPNLFQQKELPWPVGILRRILEGTCRGLVYLHSHSPPIIHRDLKSANLLLDETFNVKICDFGLARLRDYNTVLTANVGTIHWMAPEVLTGNQYNESADIYSVGVVIWEMFTGQCPYDGMKQVEVALSVVQKGLRPIIPTTCNTAQANIIRKCWDTDPSQRFTAEQLLQEISTAFPAK